MVFNKEIRTAYFFCFLLCVAQADIFSIFDPKNWESKSSSTSTAPKDSLAAAGSTPATPNAALSTPKPSTTPGAPITGPGAFDVTKHGAVGDGKTENSKAFLAAWQAACSYSGKSTFVVPEGDFLLGPIAFMGPCGNGSPAVVIAGTLKAVPDRQAFPEDYWILFRGMTGLDVSGGGTLDGQGAETWKGTDCPKNRKCNMPPSSLKLVVIDSKIHDINLINAKGFHVSFLKSQNVHMYNMHITAPEDSPNTDGIHLSRSNSINITDSTIGVGDDCVSIGTGNDGIYVSNVFCGPGHGISVGSLGKRPNEENVANIHVKNCTLTGTDNGVRIKTWPASPVLQAKNFTFEDITMNNARFPIIIDQKYCPSKHCSDEPSNVKVSNIIYKNIRGTSTTKLAVNLDCSQKNPCENIQLDNIDLTYQDSSQELGSLCYHAKVATTGVQKPLPCILKQ
ncbi:exopolygalacturonase-like [Magnolia sinica]|uniref:exopolygalacturonase-like n=1 Tax=Magnolia sinica TaxID=86752 RepID=UPI002659B855|nr:exopolygalacturonase-like [Magnolia sinica]